MSSRESTEQGAAGRRGAEAGGEQTGEGRQPRQGSERVEQGRDSESPKHDFAEGQRPSEQGEKDHPSPSVIARNQQGLAGSGSGASGSHAGGDRSEQRASEGPPSDEHTRHGRQETPGDRA